VSLALGGAAHPRFNGLVQEADLVNHQNKSRPRIVCGSGVCREPTARCTGASKKAPADLKPVLPRDDEDRSVGIWLRFGRPCCGSGTHPTRAVLRFSARVEPEMVLLRDHLLGLDAAAFQIEHEGPVVSYRAIDRTVQLNRKLDVVAYGRGSDDSSRVR